MGVKAILPKSYPAMIHKAPLVWNTLIADVNGKRMRLFNVFDHDGFLKDCAEAVKQYDDDFEAFSEAVRRSAQYYFWSKCEWEIILSAWPPRAEFDGAKIDVYDQITLNWDVFIHYLRINKEKVK